jgi:hypothetical protein
MSSTFMIEYDKQDNEKKSKIKEIMKVRFDRLLKHFQSNYSNYPQEAAAHHRLEIIFSKHCGQFAFDSVRLWKVSQFL